MSDDSDRDILRFAITSFLRGEYPHPRKYRPNPCPHGTPYYEECVRCDAEHFERALAEADRIRSAEKSKDAELARLAHEATTSAARMLNWIMEQQREDIKKRR